jgi:hypothetical protein
MGRVCNAHGSDKKVIQKCNWNTLREENVWETKADGKMI